jgi:ABC-2 type transport system permease protein
MVMYALKDYISEDSMSSAMKRFVKKVAYQDAPYTTANEFYAEIKGSTADSLKETVKDLFERITVFDNKVKDVLVEKVEGNYKVKMILQASKTQSDSLGKAKDVKLNDWIDIGLFSKNEKNAKEPGKELIFKKYKITSKDQVIELVTKEEPFMVGVDPDNKLIDLDPEDNLKTVENHKK